MIHLIGITECSYSHEFTFYTHKMVYIFNLNYPKPFLIGYILSFIEVRTGDLQILRQMTSQCATLPPYGAKSVIGLALISYEHLPEFQ